MDNINRPISIREIDSKINNPWKKKHPAQIALLVNLAAYLRKKLYPYPKSCPENTLLIMLYEATLLLYQNQTRTTHTCISHNIEIKILNKILVNWIQQHVKGISCHGQVRFIPGTQDGSTFEKQVMQCIIHL